MIHTDGFVIGRNPSAAGGGYTLSDGNGKVILKRTITNLPKFTNNDGELRGIVHALHIAYDHDVVITDSMIALAWVKSGRAKARPDLDEICAYGQRLLHSKNIDLRWRPREDNLAGIHNEFHGNKKAYNQALIGIQIRKGQAEHRKRKSTEGMEQGGQGGAGKDRLLQRDGRPKKKGRAKFHRDRGKALRHKRKGAVERPVRGLQPFFKGRNEDGRKDRAQAD